ncbi:GtrA family protein [Kibdelosporangium philippinense]|uniref:GtrA family protein n=1 Tax=Kibdelosporangium philippinense TaxID=211113 RepID=UPI00360E2710
MAAPSHEFRNTLILSRLFDICSCQAARVQTTAVERGRKFNNVMAAIAARLPFGLSRIVPPSLLGFAVINSFTFGVDLLLLFLLHGVLDVVLWLSITIAYACAFALSYFLNRAFNFRSHAPVGPQFGIYVVVVVINYLAWILGVGSGLAALGVDYRIARLAAGACEAVYMYAAMRWVVFRK